MLLAALENRKVDIMATSTPDPEQAVARGYRPAVLLTSVRSVKSGIIPDGRLSQKGSDAYQDVLLATGGLGKKVSFDAVFSNAYLPGPGGR